MVIAPDGVDLERYADLPGPAEARRALRAEWQPEGEACPCPPLSPEVFTAGYTGHLYAGRGEELLLSLAARLPEVTFLLAGGDPQDLTRLHAEARTRHLTNLILTGFIPNADLPRYQAACDVLLMPYQRRVAASSGGDIARYLSPMKLFEYLACARPILSSDLPALREVLSPDNAVLLPPDEVEAWAAALLDLQHHPERSALAAQARETDTSYTWEKRAALVLDF
jgi:glycosyltransferase involved in cell wall biosynthesis